MAYTGVGKLVICRDHLLYKEPHGRLKPLRSQPPQGGFAIVAATSVARTSDSIIEIVWGPNHHGTPRTIDNFVAQLRAKLEVDLADPRHLVTVRGVGYRFVA